MMDISSVLSALRKEFPVPDIDPQWVRECMQALADDGQDPSLHAVREQYLFSDLAQSTAPPSRPPLPANAHKIRLFPRHTLLQILSMTEIGSSAFQLQTVAEQRKDIINGTTLIRRMGDELNDEEEQEIKEGKMPVYPRGMLQFELTMGDGVILDAIEFRKVPGIILGETSLGAKLRVRNVRVLRGILMLEPANSEFLGSQVDYLEAQQAALFLDNLAQRLKNPMSNQPRPVARARARPVSPAPVVRAAPTSRPRQAQDRPLFSDDKSDIKIMDDPIPITRNLKRPVSTTTSRRMSPPLSARRPARAASTAASARVTDLYSQSAEVDQVFAQSGHQDDGSINSNDEIEDDDDSMEFDDSFLRQVDAVEAKASIPVIDLDDEEDEFDFADDESFFRRVDEVEKQAVSQTRSVGGATLRFFPVQSSGHRGSNRKPVYVVDSDGDSGKENNEPDIVYISD